MDLRGDRFGGIDALRAPAQRIRAGIIGLDTSHVVEFTKLLNDPKAKPPVNAEETLEILAFMDADDESQRQGGSPVSTSVLRADRPRRALIRFPF